MTVEEQYGNLQKEKQNSCFKLRALNVPHTPQFQNPLAAQMYEHLGSPMRYGHTGPVRDIYMFVALAPSCHSVSCTLGPLLSSSTLEQEVGPALKQQLDELIRYVRASLCIAHIPTASQHRSVF